MLYWTHGKTSQENIVWFYAVMQTSKEKTGLISIVTKLGVLSCSVSLIIGFILFKFSGDDTVKNELKNSMASAWAGYILMKNLRKN